MKVILNKNEKKVWGFIKGVGAGLWDLAQVLLVVALIGAGIGGWVSSAFYKEAMEKAIEEQGRLTRLLEKFDHAVVEEGPKHKRVKIMLVKGDCVGCYLMDSSGAETDRDGIDTLGDPHYVREPDEFQDGYGTVKMHDYGVSNTIPDRNPTYER